MTAAVQLWRYRSLIGNLAQRELKLRHKKTILGWLWSLINPAASLGIYTLVFGYFLIIRLVLYALGVGWMVSLLNLSCRDGSHLVGIGLQIFFYATPIIYPFSFVPVKLGGFPIRQVFRANPITQFVGLARDRLYDNR